MGEEYPFLTPQTTIVRTPEHQPRDEHALAEWFAPAALERHRARPRGRPAFTLLAEAAGSAVGACLLAHERRALGAAALDVAALELRSARAELLEPLLAAAASAAADAGLPFLTLRGAPAAYAAFGLAPCALRSAVALPPLPPAPLRHVSAADAEDLAALAAALPGLPLAPLRAPPDWRWLLAAPQGWLALDDGRGRLVAYGRLVGGTVVEAAAADAGAARTLLGGLAGHGARTLALPPAHPVARAALLLGGAGRLDTPPADGDAELWGVVDLPAALEALAPELARRLAGSRYAGWSGAVRLQGDAGAATIRCAAGAVEASGAPGPVDVIVGGLGLAGAAQLILGYRQAADLRATGELRCADVDLGLVDVLFPPLL
jgi:hypothetical protein